MKESQEKTLERDPVCGMNVEAGKAAAKVEYLGKIYYFCAPGCAKRFQQAPEKYLQPARNLAAPSGLVNLNSTSQSPGPAAAPHSGPWWTPPLRPPRGSAAVRRGMNQRKCSCSLSLSRSSLRVAGVPQTQPPSLNGSLPRRAESTRHGALHLPGGGPPKWSGVAAAPTLFSWAVV